MGRPIEIILLRQLASYLALPILLVDRELNLLFFNESAEAIVGQRFEETGEIGRGAWSAHFRPCDEDGVPIPPREQPLAIALDHNMPAYRRATMRGLDGVPRRIEGLALPLETRDSGLVGAAGIFWEVGDEAVSSTAAPAPAAAPRSRHAVEVILLKRLAQRLLMPTFVIDADGRLLFWSSTAEPLIGRAFSEVGRVHARDWYENFHPSDEDGSPIKREDHPIRLALRQRKPSYRRFQFQGLDGIRRRIAGAAFPLVGQGDRHLGAVGIFWELPP